MRIQSLVFILVVRPILALLLGLRVRNRSNLPEKGPAIILANHNSHLDTFVLMSLLKTRALSKCRPVAAADYFLSKKALAWILRNVLNIIPIDRSGGGAEAALAPVREALSNDEIVILYPEGSRGEPEKLTRFRRGAAVLIEEYPDVPVIPVFLYGLGRALPKGDAWFVPFFCDAVVGDPMDLRDMPTSEVPQHLSDTISQLGEGLSTVWYEEKETERGG